MQDTHKQMHIIQLCAHTWIHTHTNVHAYVHTGVHINTSMHAAHIHIHICTQTRARTYIHTHTHTRHHRSDAHHLVTGDNNLIIWPQNEFIT